MPRTLPEITQDSPLGKFLTEQAKTANTIVEVGTGSGLGSTMCLYRGFKQNPTGLKFITIEGNLQQWELAVENQPIDPRFHLLLGTLA